MGNKNKTNTVTTYTSLNTPPSTDQQFFSNGTQRDSMGLNGTQRDSMGLNGTQWDSMGLNGTQWEDSSLQGSVT